MPPLLYTTEVALLGLGLLLLASVLLGGISSRSGVPVLVLFLGLGMLAGSQGIGHIAFADYGLSYEIGTAALVLILFDGGLRTPLRVTRSAAGPAATLATFGAAMTAGIVGAAAHLLGFSWTQGLLLGAIVASTDAAAVFSVLRSGGIGLNERIAAIVELESGLNDPTGLLLTTALVSVAAAERPVGLGSLLLQMGGQLAIGFVVGVAMGLAARELLSRIRLRVGALYPVLTMSLAFLTYGCASLAYGSGFLAVYAAGLVVGNARLPRRSSLLRAHDFMAWAGQIVMFVVLGLLVSPSRIAAAAPTAVVIAVFLAFLARPLAVAACLEPFGFHLREIVLVGWVGLRGAVPIVLAIIPVLGGIPGADMIFDTVFFVVLVSALAQGGTTRWLTQRLKLAADVTPRPAALVEIESSWAVDDEILSFFIASASAVCGARLADIPFPESSFVMLIVRGEALVAPRGDTVLAEGDHVFVFCPREDVPTVRLLFGGTDS
jgi:cell volume regulation protein A